MPRSERLSTNPLSSDQATQFLVLTTISFLITLVLPSYLRLGFSKGVFPVGLPVNFFKVLQSSSVLATWLLYLILQDLIILTSLVERSKL
jgi:hypothetical protein